MASLLDPPPIMWLWWPERGTDILLLGSPLLHYLPQILSGSLCRHSFGRASPAGPSCQLPSTHRHLHSQSPEQGQSRPGNSPPGSQCHTLANIWNVWNVTHRPGCWHKIFYLFSVTSFLHVAQANRRLAILLLTLQSTSTVGMHHPTQLQSCILEFFHVAMYSYFKITYGIPPCGFTIICLPFLIDCRVVYLFIYFFTTSHNIAMNIPDSTYKQWFL